MNTKTTKNIFTNLPAWAQGLIATAVVGGILYGGYKLMHAPKEIKQSQGSRQEDRAVNSEYDKLVKAGKNPTLSTSQMIQYANQLFAAMDGYGTDEKAVISILSNVKNQTDLLGIIKAYGVRTLSSGRLNPEPDFTGTLGASLSTELSRTWLDSLNAILTKKGITQKF